MEYQDRKDSTDEGIADLMTLNAESALLPLDEPDFNYENFSKREIQWTEAQMALNMGQGTFPSPYLRNQNLGKDGGKTIKPNPTKT